METSLFKGIRKYHTVRNPVSRPPTPHITLALDQQTLCTLGGMTLAETPLHGGRRQNVDAELRHRVLAKGAAQEPFLCCARAAALRPSLAKRQHVSVCNPLLPCPTVGCPRTFRNTSTTSTSPRPPPSHPPAPPPTLDPAWPGRGGTPSPAGPPALQLQP